MTQVETSRWDFEDSQLPYRDQLFKAALRMTRSVEETEDVLQETYLKAYRYYHRYEEGTNLKAWLFRIMKNSFINMYRKRISRPNHLTLEEAWESVENEVIPGAATALADPEQDFLDRSLDSEVRQALVSLPHEYKMVVLLVDLQGLPYQEVAEVLAIPVGTVMSRLYRGRKKMERALLSFGRRYNYLLTRPENLRDETLDVPTYFPQHDTSAADVSADESTGRSI